MFGTQFEKFVFSPFSGGGHGTFLSVRTGDRRLLRKVTFRLIARFLCRAHLLLSLVKTQTFALLNSSILPPGTGLVGTSTGP